MSSDRGPRGDFPRPDRIRHAGSPVKPRLIVGAASSGVVSRIEAVTSRWSATAAVGFTGAAALAFVLVRPPVGDFWAAQARQYAALHGVGLNYWFGWFGGTVPGHYSILAPFLLKIADPSILGAASTVASVALCRRLLRPSPHAMVAAWTAAIGGTFSLWSGRVPFALGTALMLAGVVAVLANRRGWATAAGAASSLISPVSGAFLALGLCGIALHDRDRRGAALWAAGAAGACLIAAGLYFGLPGSEGFPLVHGTLALATTALLLLARPPAAVRTVVVASVIACPLLVFVPNGMGTNFERFVWICLPVAVVATGQARRALVYGTAAIAVLMGVIGSAHDLYVAAQPMSKPSYVEGLARQLDGIPGLADYRVEVIPDGTHVAAYALLSHATLARGYETQSDRQLNQVLLSAKIDAASFRQWLDENAVAYVALDRRTLQHNPEDKLVRSGRLPYLHQVWADENWMLFSIDHPVPIAPRPASVVDADQAQLVLNIPHPGRYDLRLRWSRFLRLAGTEPTGRLEHGLDGHTVLWAQRAGTYTLTG